VNPLFQQWLQQHFPERAARVMARIREMRGGKDYEARFGERLVGSGVWAQLLRQRFHKACQRLGLNRERVELDLTQFVRPERVPHRAVAGKSRAARTDAPQASPPAGGPDDQPRQASLF
jgi:hypothetical protein